MPSDVFKFLRLIVILLQFSFYLRHARSTLKGRRISLVVRTNSSRVYIFFYSAAIPRSPTISTDEKRATRQPMGRFTHFHCRVDQWDFRNSEEECRDLTLFPAISHDAEWLDPGIAGHCRRSARRQKEKRKKEGV